MNKGRRQELALLKYKKRVKKHVQGEKSYFTKDGKVIKNPKAIDIINDRGFTSYKNHPTLCSCYMCSGAYKYNRAKDKKKKDIELIREINYKEDE